VNLEAFRRPRDSKLNATIIGPYPPEYAPPQFRAAILLKVNPDALGKLRPCAMWPRNRNSAAKNYQFSNVQWNGHPASGIAVRLRARGRTRSTPPPAIRGHHGQTQTDSSRRVCK